MSWGSSSSLVPRTNLANRGCSLLLPSGFRGRSRAGSKSKRTFVNARTRLSPTSFATMTKLARWPTVDSRISGLAAHTGRAHQGRRTRWPEGQGFRGSERRLHAPAWARTPLSFQPYCRAMRCGLTSEPLSRHTREKSGEPTVPLEDIDSATPVPSDRPRPPRADAGNQLDDPLPTSRLPRYRRLIDHRTTSPAGANGNDDDDG